VLCRTEAAVAFGQDDDITVLTLTWLAAPQNRPWNILHLSLPQHEPLTGFPCYVRRSKTQVDEQPDG
jgi:hypothetical protein